MGWWGASARAVRSASACEQGRRTEGGGLRQREERPLPGPPTVSSPHTRTLLPAAPHLHGVEVLRVGLGAGDAGAEPAAHALLDGQAQHAGHRVGRLGVHAHEGLAEREDHLARIHGAACSVGGWEVGRVEGDGEGEG